MFIMMSDGRKGNMNTYEVITQRVIEAIEKNGAMPWQRPWQLRVGSGAFPMNLATGRQYKGINTFLLSMMGFTSQFWITYKQAKTLGGTVRKGEKGVPIVFWAILEKKNSKTGELEKIPFIKHSTVFNFEQCENLVAPAVDQSTLEINPIDSCEEIVTGFHNKPTITHKEQQAYYLLSSDLVNMPKRDTFESAEEYYSTLFHELVHSTAHPSRLNRKLSKGLSFFESESYSKEELIAEMGSSFLCAMAGIESKTLDNSVAYLQGWVSALREKPKMLIEAASAAQKASDHIFGRKEDQEFQSDRTNQIV